MELPIIKQALEQALENTDVHPQALEGTAPSTANSHIYTNTVINASVYDVNYVLSFKLAKQLKSVNKHIIAGGENMGMDVPEHRTC